ncbi:hypothetical protein BgAZ_106200 [Babesia gibsoni]|uniref:Uncharacterized protein n=1 Tax=Babesia gibsoni TaxID=33632 RepID=A0AAD8PG27_BABGI|nr:hypothetical protein BgAZ_106200 [Babesia gibsoni]
MFSVKDVIRVVQGDKKNVERSNNKARYPGTVPPLCPQLRDDAYMARVNVEDHITPIWEHESEEQKHTITGEAVLDYSYSLESFIRRSSIATEETVSSYDGEFSRRSESEEEEASVRGVYLDSIPSEREQPGILDPACHPICIEGLAVQGGLLTCSDMSPYRDQFEIQEYEWFVGVDDNCPDRYQPEPIGRRKTHTIPYDIIGKYVFCRAHRKVELQTVEKYDKRKMGVYDPHVDIAKNAGYLPEPRFYDISSWSMIGPICMSNEWSLEILTSLSEGVYKENAFLFFNDELTRNPDEELPTKEQMTKVKVTINYESLIIENYTSTCDTPCSIKNLKKLYDARVINFEEDCARLDFEDFETEETGASTDCMLISIHKNKYMLNYLYMKFKNPRKQILFFYMLSIFRLQKNLGREPQYWADKLSVSDVSCVNEFIMGHLFNTI